MLCSVWVKIQNMKASYQEKSGDIEDKARWGVLSAHKAVTNGGFAAEQERKTVLHYWRELGWIT